MKLLHTCIIIAVFIIHPLLSFSQTIYSWGFPETKAVPGDYDADGITDLGVYHEQTGRWYIYSPGNNSVLAWNLQWGFTGGEPVALDYDGDGATDLGVYCRQFGYWYIYSLHKNEVLLWAENLGANNMQPVASDYSGNGADEIAVYEENSGRWYITRTPEPEETTDIHQLAIMYSNAVVNASNTSPDKIYKNLTVITTNNNALIWRKNPTTSKNEVKAVSFMPHSVATNYYHTGQTTSLKYVFSWVTMAPELKKFCQNYSGTNITLRLKQLLGLPATCDNDTIVEYWVDPAFLVRPSPDPQITDSVAELDFNTEALFSTISTNYITWFTNNITASDYSMSGGIWGAYPWTRLGYTYDWALPTNKIVGLSEFIIPGKLLWETESIEVTVEVELIINAINYADQ